MTTVVINCHGGNRDYDVYIGRRTWPIREHSKWRNPFPAKKYGQEGCIKMHKEWLLCGTPDLTKLVPSELNNQRLDLLRLAPIELKDKVLGCWCKPDLCYGDTLAALADSVNIQVFYLC